MKLIEDVKLDFKDVMILPQRSQIKSRSDVDLKRTFKFKHTNYQWTGIPIIASNLDTTGSFKMAKSLTKLGMLTALHKHYSEEELVDFFIKDGRDCWDNVFYTIGSNEKDLVKLLSVKEKVSSYLKEENKDEKASEIFPRFLHLDVANGYTESFVRFLEKIRKLFPNSVIMAGNVVTPNMAEELVLHGADIVKIGIGNGCTVAGTKINTKEGLKEIQDIVIGDEVLTHRNRYRKVLSTNKRKEEYNIVNIKIFSTEDYLPLELKFTGNHKFLTIPFKKICKYKDKYEDGLISLERLNEKIIENSRWEQIEYFNIREDALLFFNKNKKHYDWVLADKIEPLPFDDFVYDFEVEEDHSYTAEGIIVHNSFCITRLVAGIGQPQYSSISSCESAIHNNKGYLCSDGGITTPGDAAKSFCAGADFSILGGYLAGSEECDGEWEEDEKGNKLTLKAYGMSSKEANDKYNGGLKDYKAAEGKCVILKYKGKVEDILQNILGGIRSCCTYIGASKIEDMPNCAVFIKVNRQHNDIFDHLERK